MLIQRPSILYFAEQWLGCCAGMAEGAMGCLHPTGGCHVVTEAGPAAPSFSHKQLKDQHELLPAARACCYQQKNTCSLWRRAFLTSSAAASPRGTDPGHHPGSWPTPRSCLAFPCHSTTAMASLAFQCCSSYFYICFLTYQLIIFHPAPRFAAGRRSPLRLAALGGGNVGPLSKCTTRGKRKCW